MLRESNEYLNLTESTVSFGLQNTTCGALLASLNVFKEEEMTRSEWIISQF